jgi:hypothetical protein
MKAPQERGAAVTPGGAPGPREDPREIVTPYAFTVAPELLGQPLASPARRGVAMAVDGLLLAILANSPGLLLGLASGRPSSSGATVNA